MPVRGKGILPHGDAPNGGDFRGHLGPQQNAPLAWLGPLGKLDFKGPHRLVGGQLAQFFQGQAAVLVAAAVFGRADLENDVAAPFQMIGRQAPFPRIHPAPGLGCAPGQGLHRRFGNGAETHAADIQRGAGGERLLAPALPDNQGRGRQLVLLQHRKGGVDEKDGSRLLQVVGGAETQHAPFIFGQTIDPAPGSPVKGALFPVIEEKILAEIFPQALEEVAQMADHRVIAQHRMALLGNVLHIPVDHPEQQAKGQQYSQSYPQHL